MAPLIPLVPVTTTAPGVVGTIASVDPELHYEGAIGPIEQRLEALPNHSIYVAFDITAAPVWIARGRAERMPDDMQQVQGGMERVGQLSGIVEGAR